MGANAKTTTRPPDTTSPSVSPEAPTTPSPEGPRKDGPARKEAPRTMRDLRLATGWKRRAAASRPLEDPLRGGLRLERVPDPAVFVLFGSTGGLAHRKVVPALFQLWRTHLLPSEAMIVAAGRRPYTDDAFRAELKDALDKYSRVQPADKETWDDLAERIVYHRGDFNDPAMYTSLAERLDDLDEERGTRGNRLFYLATQPSAFPEIVQQLGKAGLDHEHHERGWRRVVIEKPFGHDLESAVKLNREVLKVFRERQVYRIDHYLGKETVRNLLVFRFANGIFEPIWNRRYVDHIQITVAESLGVEERGAFYEETGAARDVLQNHLLQLLSLVAMEPPATFAADALRDEKLKVLRAIAPPSRQDVAREVVRGQYDKGWVAGVPVKAYREEPEVDAQSETETFIAARFEIDDWRWSGVPFYLRTGKRLAKRASEIAIQFRDVPHRLFAEANTDPQPNLLAIRVQPDEGILLRFGSKVPGLGLDIRQVTMDFTYGTAFSTDAPDAYETLILDAMLGDQSLFTRADEVEAAWAIVNPIHDAWLDMPAPAFPNYAAGSWGPEDADELIQRDGRNWRRM